MKHCAQISDDILDRFALEPFLLERANEIFDPLLRDIGNQGRLPKIRDDMRP
jgi:hypothetical protein